MQYKFQLLCESYILEILNKYKIENFSDYFLNEFMIDLRRIKLK
jgi:hypothetical protein